MSTEPPVEPEPPDAVTCPTCAAPNEPNTDFCAECGRPLSATSTLDPLKTIQAEGFMYRAIAAGRVSGFVLVVWWVLTLTGALSLTGLVLRGKGPPAGGVALVLTWGLGGAILYQATRRYLRRRREAVATDATEEEESDRAQ